MRKSSNFKYFVSEGVKSYTINGLMSLASTVIVVASLVVFGIYLLFSMNINYIAKQLEAECEIRAWIDESVKPHSAAMQDMENKIKAMDNVDTIEFYSNEKALADYAEMIHAKIDEQDKAEENEAIKAGNGEMFGSTDTIDYDISAWLE